MLKAANELAVPLAELAAASQSELNEPTALHAVGLCSLEEPKADHIAFTRMRSAAAIKKQLQEIKLGALIVHTSLKNRLPDAPCPLLFSEDPSKSFIRLIPIFFKTSPHETIISDRAYIHPTASIGRDVSIGPFAVVSANAHIGDGTILHPHVVVYEDAFVGSWCVLHSGSAIREGCRLADGCVVQNGAVIGADGFGYIPDENSQLLPVPQVGIVELANSVDVGANACIDRAALGSTVVGAGTKIDNLVQVGHNSKIGTNSILCGQVGVSGSCRIGNNVILGGGVGVADHVTIPDRSRFAARSGVTSNIIKSGDYAGWPAVPAAQWRKITLSLQKLPKLITSLREDKAKRG